MTAKDAVGKDTAGRTPGDGDKAGALSADLEVVDHLLNAMMAQVTGGVSPAAVASAWIDWGLHLASSPAKRP